MAMGAPAQQTQTQFSLDQLPDMITRQQSPQVLAQFLEWLMYARTEPIPTLLGQYREEIAKRVQIEGAGLKPIAVTLSGTASIAGFLLSLAVFDSIRYVITSPEVKTGNVPVLKLSHAYYRHLVEELGVLEPIIVNFSDIPKYEEAQKLFEVLKQGAIIVNGITAELGIWLGRNAGIGRLIILRPLKDRTVLRYV